ncbi:nucleolar protein 4-like isoform X2 [Centruroides vittatus]|uniref:nucleolar protein 4-like isoform X2 n=1 Tax=Centruroides sculpturatus TaxID=218467 RepID=UPI000C6D87E4|nr:nucleolar protein 4-like isoform X2 [Centruroides sculpturatus]
MHRQRRGQQRRSLVPSERIYRSGTPATYRGWTRRRTAAPRNISTSMERRHNTRHAAALAAAAAAAANGKATSSTAAATNQAGRWSDARTDMFESFQSWAMKTYGDTAKTKTVTRKKYHRIVKILKGEEQTNAENSKFRFWVKAKGFRMGPPCSEHTLDAKKNEHVLYVPCSRFLTNGSRDETVYKKVAIVENFFDIIYGVHVEMEGRGGKHAGQKRTYKAIAETYAFLPREAVTHFLMSCADCQKRMHLGPEEGGKGGNHSNDEGSSSPESSDLPDIDYSVPITTTYLKHMRSLGYSREDALNLDRDDSISNVDSEDSEISASTPVHDNGIQTVDYHVEDGEGEAEGTSEPPDDHSGTEADDVPLDMSRVRHENGHVNWSPDLPINMTKNRDDVTHQDHSYDRMSTSSPCNGSVIRDDLSVGTKDEDDDEEEDDTEKIDTNKYDPDRLKAFNMFVRLFVDENLDRMVPISRQPKDKIQAIIDSCSRQFPECSERSRKRIRTYLKSCRRHKRLRDQGSWETSRTAPHLTSPIAEQILANACENESRNAKRMRLGLKPIPADYDRNRSSYVNDATRYPSSRSPHHTQDSHATNPASPSSCIAMVTVNGTTCSPTSQPVYRQTTHDQFGYQQMPLPTSSIVSNGPTDLSLKKSNSNSNLGNSNNTTGTKYSLNPNEVAAVKQLIAGYRESAAFLLRSAEELEHLLTKHN